MKPRRKLKRGPFCRWNDRDIERHVEVPGARVTPAASATPIPAGREIRTGSKLNAAHRSHADQPRQARYHHTLIDPAEQARTHSVTAVAPVSLLMNRFSNCQPNWLITGLRSSIEVFLDLSHDTGAEET